MKHQPWIGREARQDQERAISDHTLVPPSSHLNPAQRLAPHGLASIIEEAGMGYQVSDSHRFGVPIRNARSA